MACSALSIASSSALSRSAWPAAAAYQSRSLGARAEGRPSPTYQPSSGCNIGRAHSGDARRDLCGSPSASASTDGVPSGMVSMGPMSIGAASAGGGSDRLCRSATSGSGSRA